MRHLRQLWNNRFLWLAAGALVAVLGRSGSATAQQAWSPAVEELRRTLRDRGPREAPGRDLEDLEQLEKRWQGYLKQRAETLDKRIKALDDRAGELRQALTLPDWGDVNEPDAQLRNVDRRARNEVAKHFAEVLRGLLKGRDTTSQLAAIVMVGEMGANVRGAGAGTRTGEADTKAQGIEVDTSFAGSLTPTLEELATNEAVSFRVRAAAARALGKVYPNNPEKAADVLGQLLRSGDVGLRRAAADGLAGMMGVVRQLMPFSGPSTPTGVGTSPAYLDRAGARAVAVAGRGLGDPDREVRQACLEAIHATSSALAIAATSRLESGPTGFLAVARALNEQAGAVGSALDSSEPPVVRRLAAEILADMGYARQQMLQGPRRVLGTEPVPLPRRMRGQAPAAEIHRVSMDAEVVRAADRAPQASSERLLRTGLEKARGPVADSLRRDRDVRVRLAAVEALETLGSFAEPAAPALVQAMGDPDRFVRWSATRALGELSPRKGTMAGFIRGLRDPDVDVRLAAAEAIRRYGPKATDTEAVGPAAADVVAALSATVGRGDVEVRVAAINTLRAVGAREPSAARALVAALDHPDVRVRRAAASALGPLGSDTDQVIGALQAAMRDEEAEVRQAASDALLDITQRARK